MSPKKTATDASTDPNDRDLVQLTGDDAKDAELTGERRTAERDDSPAAAFERVLAFAEGRGEEYPGAVNDHAIIRAALGDGGIIASDLR